MRRRTGRPRLTPGTPGEVQVRQLPDGRWWARVGVRDPSGEFRRIERTRTSKAAARNAALDAAVAIQPAPKPAAVGVLSAASPLRDAVVLWRSEHGDQVRRQTMEQYESVIRVQLEPLMGVPIGDLTTSRLDAEIQTVKSTVPARARQMRTLLRMIFDLVVRHDVLSHNPVLSTATVPQRRGKVEALTPERSSGLRSLLAERTADEPPNVQQIAHIVSMQLGTTARVSEVLGLRRPDLALDAEPPTATFSHIVVPGSGKGAGPVLQEVPKSDNAILTRPLPAFAVDALRAAMALPLDPGPDDLVFPNLKGAPRQPSGVRRELKALTAGTPYETSHTHLFRKTAVTQAAREMGLEAASELAGHSDTRVTKRHYVAPANVAPDARAALDKLA